MKVSQPVLWFLTVLFIILAIAVIFYLVSDLSQPYTSYTVESEDPAASIAGLFIYFSFYFAPVIFGGLTTLYFYKRRANRRASIERAESYIEGGIKEKLIHRELEEWEKFALEQKYKRSKNREFDLDRRAPVFLIQGRLVKLESPASKSLKLEEEWNVRGLSLTKENLPDIQYKDFEEGDELGVEFSPYSKWVWDDYKLVGGKRVWMMNLAEESFKQLAAGKAKVMPRAAFSTHRIDEMRDGDLITFSCLGIAVKGTHLSQEVKVQYVRHYFSLEALLKAEGWENVFPQAKNFEEALTVLDWIRDYPERIKKGGVYAIGVKLVPDST